MVGYNNAREWIDQARNIGELKVLEGIDPNLEVGTIVQIDAKNEGPAILFNKLKGYRDGFRILTNFMANIKLFNLSFGVPIENSIQESVEALKVKAASGQRRQNMFLPMQSPPGPYLRMWRKATRLISKNSPSPYGTRWMVGGILVLELV